MAALLSPGFSEQFMSADELDTFYFNTVETVHRQQAGSQPSLVELLS